MLYLSDHFLHADDAYSFTLLTYYVECCRPTTSINVRNNNNNNNKKAVL